MLFYIYMYNRHVFSINPLSRVNIIVIISCRGRVVTNVVSTCDPTPLFYMQLNIIKRKRKKTIYGMVYIDFRAILALAESLITKELVIKVNA